MKHCFAQAKLIGLMKQDVHLLGTDLRLKKGELVCLTPVTNLPDSKYKFFAKPLKKRKDWLGDEDDSIVIEKGEYLIID